MQNLHFSVLTDPINSIQNPKEKAKHKRFCFRCNPNTALKYHSLSLGEQTADIYKRDFKLCRQKPTTADKNPVPTNIQPLFHTNKTKRKDHHQISCRKAPLNGPDLPTQPHPIGQQSHQHFQHFNHWSTLRNLGGSPLKFPYSILSIYIIV